MRLVIDMGSLVGGGAWQDRSGLRAPGISGRSLGGGRICVFVFGRAGHRGGWEGLGRPDRPEGTRDRGA